MMEYPVDLQQEAIYGTCPREQNLEFMSGRSPVDVQRELHNMSQAPTRRRSRERTAMNLQDRHHLANPRLSSLRMQSQLSPPLTPKPSQESFPCSSGMDCEQEPEFTNYLRAFYPFHPDSTVSSVAEESSITVPINQGDVILVHSIHANGWADGTLLESGARGWLPTNYCESYNPPSMRNLMNALTQLWDLVKTGDNESLDAFTRQDYVRAMIAGVRFFLERTGCLSRESPLIVGHVALRRLRKHLLGDLSAMVKIAKELQNALQMELSTQSVYELLDELVLRAFKVVTRSVRFLDIWSQDVAPTASLELVGSVGRPPTPPNDLSNAQQSPAQTTFGNPTGLVAEHGYVQQEQAPEQIPLPNDSKFVASISAISPPMSPIVEQQQPFSSFSQHSSNTQSNFSSFNSAMSWSTVEEDEERTGQLQRSRADSLQVSQRPSRTSSLAPVVGQHQYQQHHHLENTKVVTTDPFPAAPAAITTTTAITNNSSASAASPPAPKSMAPAVVPRRTSMHTPARYSVAHRLSYVGKATSINRDNLASERLSAAHDLFLSLLGIFLGLHLHSRSRHELSITTTQSVAACRQLLAVVEEVWARDGCRSEPLRIARDAMYTKLADLVQAAKVALTPLTNAEEVLDPESTSTLVGTTTNCIRAAGECASRTRSIIERIGDFEFEKSNSAGLADAILSAITDREQSIEPLRVESAAPNVISPTSGLMISTFEASQPIRTPSEEVSPLTKSVVPPQPSARPPPPPLSTSDAKPLPIPPMDLSPNESISSPIGFATPITAESTQNSSVRSSGSSVHPLPQMPSPILNQAIAQAQQWSLMQAANSAASFEVSSPEFSNPRSARTDSSVTNSHSNWRNSVSHENHSSASLVSTRATTPDRSPLTHELPAAMMGSFSSISELQALAVEEVGLEEQMLEKTYAHELIYNKDGQVSGGSLPALVEKLTMHDSTPDATFVTAFYLTFRLFTTPVEFARSLVDRFEYVGDSRITGLPVRLRVYNVFKGWLESNWQKETDVEAIPIINDFAYGRLREVLPTTSKRLVDLLNLQLDQRTPSVLVPKLVSSFVKTGSSLSLFSDGQNATPNITKGQVNALRAHKAGGPACSILDFDALELARQFTLIAAGIFCKIGPEELLALEWTKKNSQAFNVKAMSSLSTDLTNLVADTILGQPEPKKRAVVIKQWVKISMRCLELHNYDSLMAIVCSLNSSMVLRLKKTWEVVSQKTKVRFEELKAIVDIGRNYSVLRQRLQNHVAPCIPFVGIYLTDLTFVDAGNQESRQLPDDGTGQRRSVINFDKHMKTAKIIGQLQRFQVPYKLTPVPELQEWMETQITRMRSSTEANVQNQYRRSLLLEPRETQPSATSQTAPPPLQRKESSMSIARMGMSEASNESHKSKESFGGNNGTGMSAKDKFNFWAMNNLHIGGGSSSSASNNEDKTLGHQAS